METEMGDYIIKILSTDMQKVFSWGASEFNYLDNGLQFKVNGFKHRGYVVIEYDYGHDLFNVSYLNFSNRQSLEPSEGIYFDELVDVIDKKVEYTSQESYCKEVDNYLRNLK